MLEQRAKAMPKSETTTMETSTPMIPTNFETFIRSMATQLPIALL